MGGTSRWERLVLLPTPGPARPEYRPCAENEAPGPRARRPVLGPIPTPERPLLTAVRQDQIIGRAGTPGLKGPAYVKSSHVNVAGRPASWKVVACPRLSPTFRSPDCEDRRSTLRRSIDHPGRPAHRSAAAGALRAADCRFKGSAVYSDRPDCGRLPSPPRPGQAERASCDWCPGTPGPAVSNGWPLPSVKSPLSANGSLSGAECQVAVPHPPSPRQSWCRPAQGRFHCLRGTFGMSCGL